MLQGDRPRRCRPGTIGGAGRPVRHRQVDAAAHRRPARAPDGRRGRDRRPRLQRAGRRRAHPRCGASAIGFVYQFHHLLPDFTALENVAMPQLIAGRSRREARSARRDAARASGLGAALDPPPGPPVRRRAAAGRDRPRARQRARACSWPTSPRAISTRAPPRTCSPLLIEVVRDTGTAGADRHPQPRARRADGRDFPPCRGPIGPAPPGGMKPGPTTPAQGSCG